MRALQVTALTGLEGLKIVDLPEPAANGGVLVDVHAIGVSFPDLLRSQGLYQEKTEPPFIPCNEIAGIVVEAPPESGFKAGDRVAGNAKSGAAERVVTPPSALVKLPPSLTFEQGAGLTLNYQTAVFGLEFRGRMKQGETVLIHGAAGGTGTAAIQVAKALGGRSIAVVSSDDKERIAREAGADEVVRSDGPWKDRALELTGGKGVDIVWDPVAGDRFLDTIRVLAAAGRWVVIGFVGGPIPQVPLNRVLLKNIDVVGTYIGGWLQTNPSMTLHLRARVAAMIESGHIRPVTGSLHPFERAVDAFRDLAERRALGKVVLKIR